MGSEKAGQNQRQEITFVSALTSAFRNMFSRQQKKSCRKKKRTGFQSFLMNPQNGEIYACVNVPEFDLNQPFQLNEEMDTSGMSSEKKQDLLNQMWRNPCLNDTYEPGSTFKIITMAAGLEEGVVSLEDRFYCPGYKLVDDRRIHCANRRGHGPQNFVQGAQNSCNPVFIEVGLRLGVENYYKYFRKFGLLEKQGSIFRGKQGRSCTGKNMRMQNCNSFIRAVFSDHTDPACNDGEFTDQWGTEDHTAFWGGSRR